MNPVTIPKHPASLWAVVVKMENMEHVISFMRGGHAAVS